MYINVTYVTYAYSLLHIVVRLSESNDHRQYLYKCVCVDEHCSASDYDVYKYAYITIKSSKVYSKCTTMHCTYVNVLYLIMTCTNVVFTFAISLQQCNHNL